MRSPAMDASNHKDRKSCSPSCNLAFRNSGTCPSLPYECREIYYDRNNYSSSELAAGQERQREREKEIHGLYVRH